MSDDESNKEMLNLETMIGFQGSVNRGMLVHPDGKYLVYPVGCTVAVENLSDKSQEFLSGHSNNVSCICISKSGKYIASGQTTHMGFNAETIIWTYQDKKMYCRMALHRNAVEDVVFSPNDKYLISLGGPDDGSIVVWNIEKKEAICGAPAQSVSAGLTSVLAYSNHDDNLFISAGKNTLNVWKINLEARKSVSVDVRLGHTKRIINCIKVSKDDKYFVCGTTSGDVLAVNMSTNNFQFLSPEKERFQLGVTALALLDNGELIVGSGSGVVSIIKGVNEKFKKTGQVKQVQGSVTSISVHKNQFYVGTSHCNIYRFTLPDLEPTLLKTCHFSAINDLRFPDSCSQLLVTCSAQDIRLWDTKHGQELLRISVANKVCNAVAITKDGKTIVSGWDDGCIRSYYPESGKLMYTMDNSYGGSVTALATFSSGSHIISGSNLGHVVIWDVPNIGFGSKKPIHVYKHLLLKEHKAAVTCIKLRKNDSECITSSIDGSCIFWDLNLKCRRQMIRVNTLFKSVSYHPQEHQVLTSGTDRKIGYWENYDASMIRLLDGSFSGSVNSLDVSENGMFFVSGGDDKLLKVWLYDEGEMTHIGIGHSAPITGVRISPNQKHIFSVSADGAILKWTFPFN